MDCSPFFMFYKIRVFRVFRLKSGFFRLKMLKFTFFLIFFVQKLERLKVLVYICYQQSETIIKNF